MILGVLGFTILALVLFGTALFFVYRDARREFQAQLAAMSRNSARRIARANGKIATLETRVNDAVFVINQLKMSAPTEIKTPSTPDFRKNMEDRREREIKQEEARIVGVGNN